MHFIGCDVAKATFDISLDERTSARRFANRTTGYQKLVNWIRASGYEDVCVVLEATCVYHLPLAICLTQQGIKVLVANPLRARQFAKSHGRRNKSDPLDCAALRRYGLSLDMSREHPFTPDSPEISTLRALLGRYTQLEVDLQREKNRLEKCNFIPQGQLPARSIKRQIRRLKAELEHLDEEIASLIDSDEALKHNDELLRSIKGIGEKTAPWLLILIHDNRFKTARELAAFLGLTPCHESSGTMRKRGHIPDNCNRRLRARFYFPAVSAMTHDPNMKALYQGLIGRGSTEKQAITAVMRKLVQTAFGVVNNQTPYDPNYTA